MSKEHRDQSNVLPLFPDYTAHGADKLIESLDELNAGLKACIETAQGVSAMLGNGGFKWSASRAIERASARLAALETKGVAKDEQ